MNDHPMDPAFSNNPKPEGALLALIVPHAGYMFSGSTAAFAYEYAREVKKPKRIFLLGPSHYVGFQGVALTTCSSFETPLGDLKVDVDCVEELKTFPLYELNDEIHKKEHSLELQLAFIKHVFNDVKIVPLVVGMLRSESDLKLVGQILKRQIGLDDLVVVSSDFTHFGPRYDYVPFDSATEVKVLDEDAFKCIRDRDLHGFIDFHDRTGCTICGFYPCSLLLSMLPEGSRASLLKYGTSQDTYKEDKSNSVSYLSLVLTEPESLNGWSPSLCDYAVDDMLNEEEKKNLLKLARRTVELYASNNKELKPKEVDFEITDALKEPLGVFVTLFKRVEVDAEEQNDPRAGKQLRGCIGYIFPVKPLFEAVIDNAVGASSKDFRFKRVKEEELKDLHIEISVLTPLRRVASVDEIEIGRHGVVFYHGSKQSVFLPHVATEFGWDREETLGQLAIKAGLNKNAWQDQKAQFDVFESLMFEEEE